MTGNKCVMSSHLMLQTSSLTPCPVPRGGGRGGVSNSLPLPSLPPLLQSTSCNFSFQAILLRYLTPLAKGENSPLPFTLPSPSPRSAAFLPGHNTGNRCTYLFLPSDVCQT